MSCCPHPVERHAYNGCANCGCSMRWNEHPRRDFDTSLAGLEQNKTERDDIRADRDRLSSRVAELEAENERMRRVVAAAHSQLDALHSAMDCEREVPRDMCWRAEEVVGLLAKSLESTTGAKT